MLEEKLHLELENLKTDLASLLVESREANKSLEHELMNSREKIEELQGDIKVLRRQLSDRSYENQHTMDPRISGNDRQTYVTQLEELTFQVSELKRELGQCFDEKQEIATERDIYRNKCDRLNNELNYILSGDERKIQDIDTLITESRILKEQIQSLEMEKSLALSTVAKYKLNLFLQMKRFFLFFPQKLLDRKLSKNSSVSSESCITPATSPKHQGIYCLFIFL
ncbi:unnamed protein product [Schistosoma margrebowiei]|uniref:Uncharacterized protein n=1 Tax=Schistosoma margrebowiei TaxID=48269 RepID=A0A183LTB0_9TREM|nr:unnamed protein product [Schistosoma margrebowiei]